MRREMRVLADGVPGGDALDAAPAADVGPGDGALPAQDGGLQDVGFPVAAHIWVDDDWHALPAGTGMSNGAIVGETAFGTIPEGVAAAAAGDTIAVRRGTYALPVKLDKPDLELVGVGMPVIDGDLDADGVPNFSAAIWVTAPGARIAGLELRHCASGVFVEGSSATIEGNRIHDMYNKGGSEGVGVLVWGVNSAAVSDNEIFRNDRQGIFVGYTSNALLSAGHRIEGNTVYENGLERLSPGVQPDPYGIQLMWAQGSKVRLNHVYAHQATGGHGVQLFRADNNDVGGNTIERNAFGIVIKRSAGTPIQDNDVVANGVGISAEQDAGVTTSAPQNRFCGNSSYAVLNVTSTLVTAPNGWWGAQDGPGGVGSGSGDPVSSGVDYAGYRTQKPTAGPCAAY